jgi:hypothetical protein
MAKAPRASARVVSKMIALLLAVGIAAAQDRSASQTTHGAFGFPDSHGTRLLVVSELADPGALKSAICADSGRVSVRFERRQPAREGHNGRQTPRNFDAVAGSVFRVLSGSLEENETCFLADESLLHGASVVAAAAPEDQTPCRAEIRRQITSVRKRPVANCWPLGRLETDSDVLLIEFARQLVPGADVIRISWHEASASFCGSERP